MKAIVKATLIALALVLPMRSFAGISLSVTIAPPPLLVYEQPPIPGPDYIWIPGYWAWDEEWEDYYWVPGTWELAPRPYYYWTPGYWAWIDTVFVWHHGYWGPRVGYYGGINYGYGYGGYGYEGGRWERDHFYYNTAVNNVNVTHIHNTYHTTVINNYNVQRVAYNGGDGGVRAQPRPDEEQAARERHIDRTSEQDRHERAARQNRMQFASMREGGGDKVVAATPKPAALSERQVVRAAKPDWNRERAQRGTPRPDQDRGGMNRDRDVIDNNLRRDRDNANDKLRRDRETADDNLRRGRDKDRDVDIAAPSADLDKPLRSERPQSRRHRDRSEPVKPDSSPRPESTPRDFSPGGDREPTQTRPHYERMTPIPRDDEPASEPAERPRRPDRAQRSERPDRSSFDRPERPERAQRMERPERMERMDQPQRVERPQPSMERPPIERQAQAPQQIRPDKPRHPEKQELRREERDKGDGPGGRGGFR